MNPSTRDSKGIRLAFAGLAGFVGATAAWVAWGWLTPGDFFGNGSPLLIPSMVGATGLAMGLALRRDGRSSRIWLVGIALLALAFWLFVRDGWWAAGPR